MVNLKYGPLLRTWETLYGLRATVLLRAAHHCTPPPATDANLHIVRSPASKETHSVEFLTLTEPQCYGMIVVCYSYQ